MLWMLMNLPLKLLHGVLLMIFAVFDDSDAEDSQWTYYVPSTIADLVVFGYFWWVVKQYRDHKRETDKGTAVELKNENEL